MENGATTTTSPAPASPATDTASTAPAAQTAEPTTAQPASPAADAAKTPDTASAPTGQPDAPAATKTPAEGEIKPFLGNPPAAEAKPGEKPPEKKDDAAAPQPPSEEDDLKAVTKDEAVLGKDDNLVFDQSLIKAVIPTCQKYGVSPEAAKEMANAFAKQQLEGARAMMKERADRFTKMNGEARARYSDADFAQINKGIDSCFKPGGVMNNVIRNSELGADPEFLALMHRLGAERREDTGKGATAAAGEGGGDGDGIGGISKIW